MTDCACVAAKRLEVKEWNCKDHGYFEAIKNGDHLYLFPPDPSRDGAPNTLGKCQGPCRQIVTKKEAIYRKTGPCQ